MLPACPLQVARSLKSRFRFESFGMNSGCSAGRSVSDGPFSATIRQVPLPALGITVQAGAQDAEPNGIILDEELFSITAEASTETNQAGRTAAPSAFPRLHPSHLRIRNSGR